MYFTLFCIIVCKHTNTLICQFFQKSVRRRWSPLSGVDLQNVLSRLPYKIRSQYSSSGPKIIRVRSDLSHFPRLLSLSSITGHLQFLTSLSGRPKRNSLSKRPGLLRAGSMESSLFVAPITTTSPRASNPSIRASRVDTMELQRQENTKITSSNWSSLSPSNKEDITAVY